MKKKKPSFHGGCSETSFTGNYWPAGFWFQPYDGGGGGVVGGGGMGGGEGHNSLSTEPERQQGLRGTSIVLVVVLFKGVALHIKFKLNLVFC